MRGDVSPGRGPQVAPSGEGGAQSAGLAAQSRVISRGGQPVSVPADSKHIINTLLSSVSDLELLLLPLDEKELWPDEKPLRCLL